MRRLLLVAVLALAGCIDAPRVLQGTVVSFDQAAQLLVVRDERPPNAEVKLSIAGAAIGASPAPGDVVRVAYREEPAAARATRVANISRQSEIAGKKR